MGGFFYAKNPKEYNIMSQIQTQLELNFDINTRSQGAKRRALHPRVVNKQGGGCYLITPPYSR